MGKILILAIRKLILKNTPKVTMVERSQLEIKQFLELLQFETCSKLEELPEIP